MHGPRQTHNDEDYISDCEVCQSTKTKHVDPRGLLHPLQQCSFQHAGGGVIRAAGLPIRCQALIRGSLASVHVHVDHL